MANTWMKSALFAVLVLGCSQVMAGMASGVSDEGKEPLVEQWDLETLGTEAERESIELANRLRQFDATQCYKWNGKRVFAFATIGVTLGALMKKFIFGSDNSSLTEVVRGCLFGGVAMATVGEGFYYSERALKRDSLAGLAKNARKRAESWATILTRHTLEKGIITRAGTEGLGYGTEKEEEKKIK